MLTADDLKHIKENYRLNYPEYYITATTYIEMLLNHIEAMQKEIERKDRAIDTFNEISFYTSCGACEENFNIKYAANKIIEGKEEEISVTEVQFVLNKLKE